MSGEERRRKLAEREARAAAASQTFSMRPKEEAAPSPPELLVSPESSGGHEGRRSSAAEQRRTSRRIQKSRSFIRRDLMKRCWGAVVGWYGGFLAFSLLHFADCVLRIYSIYLYAIYGLHIVAFAMLTPIQVIGAMLSIYITFHDADVLLVMHNSSTTMQKFFFFTVSLLFLGCCQLIQVKRAWSRQLHSPEVVLDMEDTKAKEAEDRASDASSLPDFGAAERITPVGLITGVPFLLVHWVSSSRPWGTLRSAGPAEPLPPLNSRSAKVVSSLGLSMSRPDESLEKDTLKGWEEVSIGDVSEWSNVSPCSILSDESMDYSMDSTVASVSDLYSDAGESDSQSPCTKTLDLDTDDCASVPVFIQSGAENVPVRSSAVMEAVSRSPLSRQCHGGVEQNILQFLSFGRKMPMGQLGTLGAQELKCLNLDYTSRMPTIQISSWRDGMAFSFGQRTSQGQSRNDGQVFLYQPVAKPLCSPCDPCDEEDLPQLAMSLRGDSGLGIERRISAESTKK
eukprot:s552_g31.t1